MEIPVLYLFGATFREDIEIPHRKLPLDKLFCLSEEVTFGTASQQTLENVQLIAHLKSTLNYFLRVPSYVIILTNFIDVIM